MLMDFGQTRNMVPASAPSTNLPGATGVPSNNLLGQSGPADVPATFPRQSGPAHVPDTSLAPRPTHPVTTHSLDQAARDHSLILVAAEVGLAEALALRQTMSGEGNPNRNFNLICMEDMD